MKEFNSNPNHLSENQYEQYSLKWMANKNVYISRSTLDSMWKPVKPNEFKEVVKIRSDLVNWTLLCVLGRVFLHGCS